MKYELSRMKENVWIFVMNYDRLLWFHNKDEFVLFFPQNRIRHAYEIAIFNNPYYAPVKIMNSVIFLPTGR